MNKLRLRIIVKVFNIAPSECYVENCGSESMHMRLKLRARAVFAAAYTPEKENEETESIISSASPPNEPETWITPAEAIYTMKLSV